MSSSNKGSNDQKIHKVIGYDVEFPFTPYGVQRAMMSRISSTLTNKENFLLESPTGTGKTLVLLCTTLAWQKKSKEVGQAYVSEKLRKELTRQRIEKLKSRPCNCGRRPDAVRSELDQLKNEKNDLKKNVKDLDNGFNDERGKLTDSFDDPNPKRVKIEEYESPYFKKAAKNEPELISIEDSDEDDSENNIKLKNLTDSSNGAQTRIPNDLPKEKLDRMGNDHKPICNPCKAIETEMTFLNVVGDSAFDGKGVISSKIKTRVPRIYYGTRTHKQITQVIRELNKTSYKKKLKMCILSSRERACINPEVRDLPTRNDRCQELIKNKSNSMTMTKKEAEKDSCPYYLDQNFVQQEFDQINNEFESEAWDIEDAAEFGRSRGVCPYYGFRGLQEDADITFCPYNYLLDPNIRKAMNINISNAVVVFDEAHNIEDICRDSASYFIDTMQISEILDSINKAKNNLIQGSVMMDSMDYLRNLFSDLSRSLKSFPFDPSDKETGDFINKKVLVSNKLIEFMGSVELGPKNLDEFRKNVKVLRGEEDQKETKESKDPNLSFAQMQFIDQLLIVLDFMYSNNNKGIENYRLVITQSLFKAPFKRGGSTQLQTPGPNRDTHVWKLHLLCMDPGTSFAKIHNLAWSVIVASGTLSPTESLKSELGCKFNNVFEGAHVINKDRVFASILSAGPRGNVELKCTYKECMRLDFQDEVGCIVRDVCSSVPNGVLCFFPSYERLESFYQRWHTTKIMGQIQSKKRLFREQKNVAASKFEEELAKYNDHAYKGGAILFAVFRGKVSEGIDFADKAARAVITIGIPFPNLIDLGVGLKKDYNDKMRPSRPQLMTGGDWYSAQAFRALNQALGRCIRHKDDWGAIIMIDSRLKYTSNLNNISRWLRQVVRSDNSYPIIHDRLRDYIERRLDDDNQASGQMITLD